MEFISWVWVLKMWVLMGNGFGFQSLGFGGHGRIWFFGSVAMVDWACICGFDMGFVVLDWARWPWVFCCKVCSAKFICELYGGWGNEFRVFFIWLWVWIEGLCLIIWICGGFEGFPTLGMGCAVCWVAGDEGFLACVAWGVLDYRWF